MSDLISRQAAIDVADAVWSVTGDKNVAKVWDQIKDLPSAEPEPHWIPFKTRPLTEEEKEVEDIRAMCGECDAWNQYKNPQPGWIPCKTALPKEDGQYIVTLKDDKEVWIDIAEWNPTFGGRWQAEFFDCEYRDIDNVVAWQPLPTPYREGGQE